MARPIKKGIDYFPLDVNFLKDLKVRKIMRACGNTAPAALICLLGNIYQDEGYYMKWDEDTRFLVADDIGTSEASVDEVVKKAVQANFFSKYLFEKYSILTSHGIQRRYEQASYRKSDNEIKKEYLIVSASNNPVNDDNNSVNDGKSTQSKGKESKGNNKRDSRNSDKPTYDESNINFQLANRLFEKIKQRQDDFKKPNLQRWANDIRLAHEQDGRTYEQLSNMIDWSQSNDFWQANILSAKKLRDKYDQMKAQALKDTKAKPVVQTAPDWDKLSAEQQNVDQAEIDVQIAKANERLRKLHEGQQA